MKAAMIDAALGISVAAVWLGVAAFARLRAPLDRLHCITFVNVVAGLFLSAGAFIADGASNRALKVLLIVVLNCVSGAAMSHATGRALLQREHP